MSDYASTLFWVSLSLIVYSYLAYPVLIHLAASVRSRMRKPGEFNCHEELPSVTVVIAAHNAEQHIRRRIDNLLRCDYPPSKLSILIGSDGSTDRTVAEARAVADPRLRVIDFPQRRGKAATLCDVVRWAESEILLFTDASTQFDEAAIRNLMRPFGSADVGVVIGNVAIFNEHGERTEGFYWRMETMLRRSEAALGIVLGASGAIYALRNECFVAPQFPVTNDDLVIPMLSHLSHGCDCAFAHDAQAFAVVPNGLSIEFRRRARIGAGALPSLTAVTPLLSPANWAHSLAFISHKVLRWVCPLLMIALLVSNVLLVLQGRTMFNAALVLQLTAYAGAVLGLFVPRKGMLGRAAHLTSTFCIMNLALLVGFFRWVVGMQSIAWKPTARPEAAYAMLPTAVPHPKMREPIPEMLPRKVG